jgi:1,4-dihydroxy-2-naphthoate octaprenyltransferase
MRLRTLTLALACVLMGSFLAWFFDAFHWEVVIFSMLTTVSLQILSNLANDYGDSIHGADHDGRKGPSRAVQSGRISKKQMKQAVILFSALSVVFGLVLIRIANIDLPAKWILFGLGVLAILAAINYTIGKRPYGYNGYGDVSVFIFFGLLAVLGTYFLHSNDFRWDILLPASATGALAVAVLNVNNIRDIESDINAGKRSLAVRLGRKNAVLYHIFLMVTAVLLVTVFVLLNFKSRSQFIWVLALPLFVRNAREVARLTEPEKLDPYLRHMAVSTLIFVLLFGLGHLV